MREFLAGSILGFVTGAAATHLAWTLAHLRKIRAALAAIDRRLKEVAERP